MSQPNSGQQHVGGGRCHCPDRPQQLNEIGDRLGNRSDLLVQGGELLAHAVGVGQQPPHKHPVVAQPEPAGESLGDAITLGTEPPLVRRRNSGGSLTPASSADMIAWAVWSMPSARGWQPGSLPPRLGSARRGRLLLRGIPRTRPARIPAVTLPG